MNIVCRTSARKPLTRSRAWGWDLLGRRQLIPLPAFPKPHDRLPFRCQLDSLPKHFNLDCKWMLGWFT